jgi:hypothetical protein
MDRATKSSALGFGQPDRVLAYHKSVHSKMWMPRGNVIYGCGYQMDAAGRINSETLSPAPISVGAPTATMGFDIDKRLTVSMV